MRTIWAVFCWTLLVPALVADPPPAPPVAPSDLAARVAALEAAQARQGQQLDAVASQLGSIRASLADIRTILTEIPPASVAGPTAPATWGTSSWSAPIGSGQPMLSMAGAGGCSSGSCGSASSGRVGLFGRMRGSRGR